MTHLYSVETVMHDWDQVADIHRFHLLDPRSDGLKCQQADVKIDVIKMLWIKSIQLRQTNEPLNDRLNYKSSFCKNVKSNLEMYYLP